MPPEAVLVDTHAVLWWQAGSDLLSAAAAESIAAATRVLVSPITFWEIAMLVEKGRVALDRPVAAWANDMSSGEVDVATLTPQIAVDAGQLAQFHGDPADRLIFSTAARLGVPLVSKDRRMADHAELTRAVRVVW